MDTKNLILKKNNLAKMEKTVIIFYKKVILKIKVYFGSKNWKTLTVKKKYKNIWQIYSNKEKKLLY